MKILTETHDNFNEVNTIYYRENKVEPERIIGLRKMGFSKMSWWQVHALA